MAELNITTSFAASPAQVLRSMYKFTMRCDVDGVVRRMVLPVCMTKPSGYGCEHNELPDDIFRGHDLITDDPRCYIIHDKWGIERENIGTYLLNTKTAIKQGRFK